MGEISVRFESLQSGEQGIRNNYAKLSTTLEQLESDLQPMINTWSGAAQESYLVCKRQWDEAALALAVVLQNIGSAVGQAHANYWVAETSARGNFP